MTRMQYNWIMRKQLEPREDPEGIKGISNFTGRIKGMHIFVGNFTYVSDLMIVEDISLIIDPRLSQVVLGKPFVEVKMDDPNITMKEYSKLEEEKARRRGKMYNWETATYGKIWNDEDVHNLRSVETEFPAIVLNDAISFDEFDDEDYTVIYDKNSFSYRIISVNNLKTDSENNNDKVNMPSFPSPEPTVSYFNDLDFFKDFVNEFPAIVYNDALTSKLDFLTELDVSPQHIDEFDLKDETSLSECDEEEQNVLYFNDLFPFNVIYPDDSKSDKDNDNDKIDIESLF
ncbi:hypothetical protein Tco_0908163 [Tanacetum coccineum]|uniref:MAK10-like protein n=1 Tax=Tanacetum coccineum TaxID=301880 RepID=A0ABQ5CNG9_9ASTR